MNVKNNKCIYNSVMNEELWIHLYRVPLEKIRMLPLLPWKDFVPLRSKWVMIFLYFVRPLPVSLSKITLMKINNCLRIGICIKRFRGDIGRASDF